MTTHKNPLQHPLTSATLGAVALVSLLGLSGSAAAQTFTEGFSNVTPDGTAISTANTGFTFVRPSTGASPILQGKASGSFGTGPSMLISSTSTSLTGVGVLNGTFSAFNQGLFSLDLRIPSNTAAGSTLLLEAGTGNTFSNNNTFSGAELTFAVQILNLQMQVRNSANAWVSLGSPLTADTNYNFAVYFNGGTDLYNYGAGMAAPATADIYLNGALFGDDVSIRDSVDVSAFRIYALSLASPNAYEVDNVNLVAAPEPTAFSALLGGTAFLGLIRRRRS